MRNYYYLVSGLQDLQIEDSKVPVSVARFREEVYGNLAEQDRKLIDLLMLENDCRNLTAALTVAPDANPLETPAVEHCGLFSMNQLQDLIASVKAQDPCPEAIPQFMYDFVQEYQDESWRDYADFAEDRLWALFYQYAMQCGNSFVSDWYRFNLDLTNIQTAITARKYELDVRHLLVGESEITQALRTSGARDWGLSQEVWFWDDIMRLQEASDLNDRERKTDMLRWQWLEDNSFFCYFTIEQLFAYMVRLGIVERWSSLDAESGQQILRKLIGELKEQTEVPAEFKTN
jgi:hypothetical protein